MEHMKTLHKDPNASGVAGNTENLLYIMNHLQIQMILLLIFYTIFLY